ncbi:MAG: hypothetical protein HY337_07985 [Gemmatimonadetes bacterium]|nr:hypothetical protein [Gemmatimonadota bacterium]
MRPFVLRAENGSRVVISDGEISQPGDRLGDTYDLGPGTFHAGLINAHDHLFRNHYPRLGAPPYRNAYEWGNDIHVRWAEEIRRMQALPRREALLFGALKNLLGAVTTVVHHDPWDDALAADFPVRVVRIRVAHSLGLEHDLPHAVAGDEHTRDRPLSMHLAEGVDAVAVAEVREAERRDLLGGDLVAVHLVGVDRDAIARIRATGTAVAWCPTSNRFLFDRTAPGELFQPGIDVLLGTDALLTADGTMLAELHEARRLGHLDDQRLREAVGRVAARRLRVPEPALAPGYPADVVFLRRPLFEARPADVALVLVGGVPRLADEQFAELFGHCGVPAEPLDAIGTRKLVAAPLGTVARRVFDLSPQCQRVLEW